MQKIYKRMVLVLLILPALATAAAAQTLNEVYLVNADTDQRIQLINNSVDLAQLQTGNLSIVATAGGTDRVEFSLFDTFSGGASPILTKTERVAPYAIAGDSNGNILPINPALGVGTYEVRATAFLGNVTNGGATKRLTFSIRNGNIAPGLYVDSGNLGGGVERFRRDVFFGGLESAPRGFAVSSDQDVNVAGVVNAAPVAVYQTQRVLRQNEGNRFLYSISGNGGPLPANTNFTLRLHFAELTGSAPGERQFGVSVYDGTNTAYRPLLTNFDIFAEAGGANKAVVREFNVTSRSNGTLYLSFEIGAAGLPAINGIEIIQTQ